MFAEEFERLHLVVKFELDTVFGDRKTFDEAGLRQFTRSFHVEQRYFSILLQDVVDVGAGDLRQPSKHLAGLHHKLGFAPLDFR